VITSKIIKRAGVETKVACFLARTPDHTWPAGEQTWPVAIAYQAPVVRTVDSAIRWINYYPKDSAMVFVIIILWIAIYPVDSAIQLLNNRDQNSKGKTFSPDFFHGLKERCLNSCTLRRQLHSFQDSSAVVTAYMFHNNHHVTLFLIVKTS